MKTLIRITGMFGAALILAVVLTSAMVLPKRVSAGCGSDVTWNIWNEIDSRWTSDTVNGRTTTSGDWSSRSEHHANNGQDWTDVQSHHWNPDGSSHGHEESSYSDSQGKGCNSDGIPRKWNSRRDTDTDSKGNRKEHSELIEEKNGKCTKYVRDREWDSKGNLVKDIKSTTEVPCGKYILEWTRVGNSSMGDVTVLWGPNTTKIYLEPGGDGTYKGNGEGVFDDKASGDGCTGSLTHPFSVDVTAKEVKFGGNDELEVSMKVTMSTVGSVTCKEGSLGFGSPPETFTKNFSIPIEDGASWTDTSILPEGIGQVIDTFTLRKQGP